MPVLAGPGLKRSDVNAFEKKIRHRLKLTYLHRDKLSTLLLYVNHFPFSFSLQLHSPQLFFDPKMIPMTIYVSNLSFTMTDDQLKKVFVPFGEVSSARIMTDKFTNRSRGFAFIEMPDELEAQKAINDLNGSPCEGRPMVVNMAKPRQQF